MWGSIYYDTVFKRRYTSSHTVNIFSTKWYFLYLLTKTKLYWVSLGTECQFYWGNCNEKCWNDFFCLAYYSLTKFCKIQSIPHKNVWLPQTVQYVNSGDMLNIFDGFFQRFSALQIKKEASLACPNWSIIILTFM